MALLLDCSACGARYALSDELFATRVSGHRVTVRCKGCGHRMEVDASNSAPRWWVGFSDEDDRELDADQIREAWARGEIGRTTLVWRLGMADWIELHQVPELAALAPPPKVLPKPKPTTGRSLAPPPKPRGTTRPAPQRPQRPSDADLLGMSDPAPLRLDYRAELQSLAFTPPPADLLSSLTASLPGGFTAPPVGSLAPAPREKDQPAPDVSGVLAASAAGTPASPVAAALGHVEPVSLEERSSPSPEIAGNPFRSSPLAGLRLTRRHAAWGVAVGASVTALILLLSREPTQAPREDTPLGAPGVERAQGRPLVDAPSRDSNAIRETTRQISAAASRPESNRDGAQGEAGLQGDPGANKPTTPAPVSGARNSGPNLADAFAAAARAPARPATNPVPGAAVGAAPAAAPKSRADVPAPNGTAARPSPAPPPASDAGAAFDRSAAAAALNAAASSAASCRKPGDPSGIAQVSVTFATSGRATNAIVNGPPFAGTPTGGCIAAALRRATVPPFGGDRVTVTKRITIP
jgi:hypothetical protein